MAKVTIEEISRITGLSRGTVSRALNDRPDISQATKQRVLEVCRKLNFKPNRAARTLATGRCLATAAIVDDLDSTYVCEYLRGATRRAMAGGYTVTLIELNGDADARKATLEAIERERIDGVLLAAHLANSERALLTNMFKGQEIVAVEGCDGLACDVLSPDEVESGRLAAKLALSNGGRDLLYLERSHSRVAADRWRGFSEECASAGLDPKSLTTTMPENGSAMSHWLSEVRPRLETVSCIVASDDALAIRAISIVMRLGREPGKDLGIIGQGNERATMMVWPELTSTDLNGEEIGERSADILLQRLAKSRLDGPQSISVAPRLVPRASTACLSR